MVQYAQKLKKEQEIVPGKAVHTSTSSVIMLTINGGICRASIPMFPGSEDPLVGLDTKGFYSLGENKNMPWRIPKEINANLCDERMYK